MKRLARKIAAAFLGICSAVSCAYAMDLGNQVLKNSEMKCINVSSNLVREEHRYITQYNYSGELSKNSFKYIGVKHVISYVNKVTNEVLAEITTFMKFKYSEKMKRAECMSTSYGCMSKNSEYNLSVSNRKANNAVDKGAGLFDVEFKYRGAVKDKISYKYTCDYLGDVNILEN